MENFTPLSATIGGVLIGLGAVMLMATLGRISGASGIVMGLVKPVAEEPPWRLEFVAGLFAAPFLVGWMTGGMPAIEITASLPMLIVGGLLVGVGTQMGSGCTSGHGVCGLARFSPRSLVATATFMAAALLTVFVVRHVLGA